jgi:hypothetical protein
VTKLLTNHRSQLDSLSKTLFAAEMLNAPHA